MCNNILGAEGHLFPTQRIEKYLAHIPGGMRDIVLEIRNIIASVAPSATEVLHSRGFSYFDAERGGTVSAGICQIIIHRDHIRLAFIHGAFLPEPRGLFEGNTKYKRYIRIFSFEDAPWDYLKELIAASARFDPYKLSFNGR